MPFTFSHPAIVLPLARLNKKFMSASGLIIGSMAPDFEYFIRMRLMQVHGHKLAGVFYFDLPVALMAVLIFQFLVRDTLIEHLPEFLQKKYQPFYQMHWLTYFKKYWYVVIWSILIGIFSHLFWDAFTHAPGYFVQFIPFLQEELLIFNVTIPSYDFMQLLSSAFGAVVILLVIIWPQHHKITWRSWTKFIRYGFFVFAVAMLVLVLRGAHTQSEIIATFLSGTLIGMMVMPFFLGKFTSQKNHRKNGQTSFQHERSRH